MHTGDSNHMGPKAGTRVPHRPGEQRRGAALRLTAFVVLSLCLHAAVLTRSPATTAIRAGSGAAISIELVPSSAGEPTGSISTERGQETVQPARETAPRPPAPASEARTASRPAVVTASRSAQHLPPAPLARARQSRPEPATTARSAAPRSARKKAASMPLPTEPTREPASVRSPEEAAASSAASASADPGDRRGDAASSIPRETARVRVRELLLADVARYFEYPWIARRRGWQGMVRLSVTVRPDGLLERVHVTRSSGYEVLDRSAVETMQRVGQLAQARHWLDGAALELPLAIVYRLTD